MIFNKKRKCANFLFKIESSVKRVSNFPLQFPTLGTSGSVFPISCFFLPNSRFPPIFQNRKILNKYG